MGKVIKIVYLLCQPFRSLGYVPLFLTLMSCAQPQVVPQITVEEEIQRDRSLGREIAQKFDTYFIFKRDSAVIPYLEKLTQKLMDSTPELRGASKVSLIQNQKGKWKSFGLPGVRIYLPLTLLRDLHFENELASTVAIQLGHILNHHVVNQLEKKIKSESPEMEGKGKLLPIEQSDYLNRQDYLGSAGIFGFSEEQNIQAVRTSVGVLYRAGYDPRGLLSLLKKFEKNPSHSPYEMGTIVKLMESARREIALFAPLRNPIVRSQSFILIQKRIQQL
jgi:predicted Zn-dependent protease